MANHPDPFEWLQELRTLPAGRTKSVASNNESGTLWTEMWKWEHDAYHFMVVPWGNGWVRCDSAADAAKRLKETWESADRNAGTQTKS